MQSFRKCCHSYPNATRLVKHLVAFEIKYLKLIQEIHMELTFFLLPAGIDTEHIVRIWACLIPAVTGLHLVGGTRAWEGQVPGFITGCSTTMVIWFFGPRL